MPVMFTADEWVDKEGCTMAPNGRPSRKSKKLRGQPQTDVERLTPRGWRFYAEALDKYHAERLVVELRGLRCESRVVAFRGFGQPVSAAWREGLLSDE